MSFNLVELLLWGKSRGLGTEDQRPRTYPLICHLLDAAAFAGRVWDEYLSQHLQEWLADQLDLSLEETRSWAMLLAGLHDIGKACPGFQFRDDEGLAAPEGFPRDGDFCNHAAAGQLWLGAALKEKFGWPEDTAEAVAEVVGGHHGIFTTLQPGEYSKEKVREKGLGGGPWGSQRTAIAAAVQDLVGVPNKPADFCPDAQMVMCAVVVLADWLASRTGFVRSRMTHVPPQGDPQSLERFLAGSIAATEGELARSGLVRLKVREAEFAEEFGFQPNRLQASLLENLPQAVSGSGMLIVTEQMGLGKTEAALYAARILGAATGTAGMAFLLPTMATSNAMESRLVEYVERNAVDAAPVNLVHSMAWLRRLRSETESPEAEVSDDARELAEVTEWLRGGKKAAFAPVCVGTIDQALLSVLPLKYNAFRMLAFANKTIVIDEVHAFDEFVRVLLCGFLSWCGHLGVPVVLMSATLPESIARELAKAYLGRDPGAKAAPSYPGWVFLERDRHEPVRESISVAESEERSLRIDLRECETVDEALQRGPTLARELEALCTGSGCAAVVCTTVKEAQQTYIQVAQWIAREGYDVEMVLLHSNMPMWQRETITDYVVRGFGRGENADRSGRTIIISTQVLEQSVDIDMDLIISDLAPMELLLQRAGRGHRHPENDARRPAWAEHPRLVVLVPEGGEDPVVPKRWSYVYPLASLIRTQRLLLRRNGGAVRLPGEVQGLIDELYTDSSLIAGHEQAERESLAEAMVRHGEAERWRVPKPRDLGSVGEFSGQDRLVEEHVSTRFDADSVRALPLFDRGGDLCLDPEGTVPLPQPTADSGRMRWSTTDVAAIIERTVPVRRSLLVHSRGEVAVKPRPEWKDHFQLKFVVPLVHRVDSDGRVEASRVAGRGFLLDSVLGLEIS
ncbi:CRISPR-associated helicase/endonuclease Cas3 [Glycomyces sp. NRRL B-16210]|uniref:CRISPR-associated helicase/endonuclease Cas3 n=1 Tax=Glycomyces sp. NRRL B-16210 TaxID=1463821 RepID=UPI0004C22142|nr:CRISPR-associated helicase/endonuclease Cas3 [Glycomyces sp. NRRL B-16210]